eukprot:6171879-Pleurochrysis_carterae.AAC.2
MGIDLDAATQQAIEGLISSMDLRQKLGQIWQPDWRAFRRGPHIQIEAAVAGLDRCLSAPVSRALQRQLMCCCAPLFRPLDDNAAQTNIAGWHLGSVLGGGGAAPTPNEPAAWREQTKNFQSAAKVPLLICSDSVHGHHSLFGATLFPHHIGQGCMRDADLVRRLAAVAALESAACGINFIFSPCAAIACDLRWGRTYESFSEDVSLVCESTVAEVKGLQEAGVPMAACVKHFVSDGATELGTGTANFAWMGAPPDARLDQGDATLSDAELRAVHVAPFRAAVDAGVLAVMVSYSSINGRKLHASRDL